MMNKVFDQGFGRGNVIAHWPDKAFQSFTKEEMGKFCQMVKEELEETED